MVQYILLLHSSNSLLHVKIQHWVYVKTVTGKGTLWWSNFFIVLFAAFKKSLLRGHLMAAESSCGSLGLSFWEQSHLLWERLPESFSTVGIYYNTVWPGENQELLMCLALWQLLLIPSLDSFILQRRAGENSVRHISKDAAFLRHVNFPL